MDNEQRLSLDKPMERSTLQVLLSGRIIITGILNEIILCLPEEKEKSEFMIESECSLMLDSEVRAVKDYAKEVNILTLLASSTTSLEEVLSKRNHEKTSQTEQSLYSIYKESQGTAEYISFGNGQNPNQEKAKKDSRYTSSTWKGYVAADGSKSSKSVTFTSQDNPETAEQDPTGMLIEPRNENDTQEDKNIRSISTRLPVLPPRAQTRKSSHLDVDDYDLWLAFLTETGQLQCSDTFYQSSNEATKHRDPKVDEPGSMLRQMGFYHKMPSETYTTHIRDDYENIHRQCPGLFWDTVSMDNPHVAFTKVHGIIRDIVNSQKDLKPMFDIDFANLSDYPTVEKRLESIRNQIAPHRLFY